MVDGLAAGRGEAESGQISRGLTLGRPSFI